MKNILFILITISTIACKKQVVTEPVPEEVQGIVEIDVAQAQNVSHFVVQFSDDGKDFSDDVIIFAENTMNPKTYEAYFKTSKIWYRIKTVDFDYNTEYTEIKRLPLY